MAIRDRFETFGNWMAQDEWLILQDHYDPEENLKYETLFGLANGYMGNRAAFEEGGVAPTLPANYIHGVFDRSEAFMRELCNTANWLPLELSIACEPVDIAHSEVCDFLRALDMQNGILFKRMTLRAQDGRMTRIEGMKFLSRAHPHRACLRLAVTALNYDGLLDIENRIDDGVTNFADMPRFRVKHTHTVDISDLDGRGAYIESRTRDYGLPIGTGTALFVSRAEKDVRSTRQFRPLGNVACDFGDAPLPRGETVLIEKHVAVCTGNDTPGVRDAVARELDDMRVRGTEEELRLHTRALRALWERSLPRIVGDAQMQSAVRFVLFQMMCTANPHDSRVNIGAKLLHGEEYGGHAFWDTELFLLPFFIWTFPAQARRLLEYRYRLLDAARENARRNGYAGAQYPWESADTGREECPAYTIEPDGSFYRCLVAEYEHHVTAAVAYGVCQYADVTGDTAFLWDMGAEILAETARFWVSRCELDAERGSYDIRGVTGPDEWHENVDNNFYTNEMARWNIRRAGQELARMRAAYPERYAALASRLGLTDAELRSWENVAQRIHSVPPDERGVIEQFEGYHALRDVVVTEWDENGMPVRPEGMRTAPRASTQIGKQADVLMLLYLFPDLYSLDIQRANFAHYEIRSLHRSSLSAGIHCLMGLRVDDAKRAMEYFERAAWVDLRDVQGNAREGIHAASAGATWQCLAFGFAGMRREADGSLAFRPRLPAVWEGFSYRFAWQGQTLEASVTAEDVRLHVIGEAAEGVAYHVNGETRWAEADQELFPG